MSAQNTVSFARPEPQTPAESPKKQALAEIVRRAGADARAEPEAYLRETRVPGGGE